MKKIILFLILVGLIIGGSIAYYQFTKTHEDMASQKAVAILTSAELFTEFVNDEQGANQKYLGKVIEVKGSVYSVEKGTQNDLNILFMEEGEMFGVACNIKDTDLTGEIEVGQAIHIKGECSGMLSDVVLIRCIILNQSL